MKRQYFYFVLLLSLIISCSKSKVNTAPNNQAQTVTSPEYIDKLLFVNKNGYQIQTTDPGALFSSGDTHISITSTGLINRLTSAEVVPIVITWKNPNLAKTTIYALGATDDNQDLPFKNYQAALATDSYSAYLQGWKTLQRLPVMSETYAIILRHADASIGSDIITTDTYQGPPNWWKSSDSTLARQLNQQGKNRATELGQVFKDLNYPIKRVITSEFYRSVQTASLINAGPTIVMDGRINHQRYNLYKPGLFLGMVAILGEQPIDNQMTMIVSHHPVNELRGVTGFPSFPAVSPFNWTGAYFVKIAGDGSLTYQGGASWGMFKCWRNLKLNKQ